MAFNVVVGYGPVGVAVAFVVAAIAAFTSYWKSDSVALDAYFVCPEELKSVARVQIFRDFLVAKAQRWHF